MLRAVDLPDPEGPVIATNSPASMSRSIRSSARTIASCSPYTLVTARNDRSGSAAAARTGLSSTAAGIRLPSLRRQIHEDVRAGSKRAGCDLGQFSVGDPRAYRDATERVSLEEPDPGGVGALRAGRCEMERGIRDADHVLRRGGACLLYTSDAADE